MNRKIICLLLLAFVTLFLFSCSDSTAPNTTPAVVLTLETLVKNSGGETYIRAESSVRNTGENSIHYAIRCNNYGAISLWDSNGIQLVLHDPALVPVCPPGFDSLFAGTPLEGGVDLVWAWDENGDKYEIPLGRYTVRTGFTYYVNGVDEPFHIEQEMQLDLEY